MNGHILFSNFNKIFLILTRFLNVGQDFSDSVGIAVQYFLATRKIFWSTIMTNLFTRSKYFLMPGMFWNAVNFFRNRWKGLSARPNFFSVHRVFGSALWFISISGMIFRSQAIIFFLPRGFSETGKIFAEFFSSPVKFLAVQQEISLCSMFGL